MFAVTIQLAMVSVGVYGPEALLSVRFAAARLVVALALGVLALSLLYFLVPAGRLLALEPALRDLFVAARRWSARGRCCAGRSAARG